MLFCGWGERLCRVCSIWLSNTANKPINLLDLACLWVKVGERRCFLIVQDFNGYLLLILEVNWMRSKRTQMTFSFHHFFPLDVTQNFKTNGKGQHSTSPCQLGASALLSVLWSPACGFCCLKVPDDPSFLASQLGKGAWGLTLSFYLIFTLAYTNAFHFLLVRTNFYARKIEKEC